MCDHLRSATIIVEISTSSYEFPASSSICRFSQMRRDARIRAKRFPIRDE